MDFVDLDSLDVANEVVDVEHEARKEWFRQRLGMFTCSRFGDLVGTGRAEEDEFTKTGLAYIYLKIAERAGSFQHEFKSKPTDWGNEFEEQAIAEYQKSTGRNVESCRNRFFKLNHFIGGTPDGLVDDDGTLEIKCPYNPAVHIETFISNRVPAKYIWQTVGHCLVTRRKWCDFVSFDPRIENPRKRLVVIRVEPDFKKQFLLERLKKAWDELLRLETVNHEE